MRRTALRPGVVGGSRESESGHPRSAALSVVPIRRVAGDDPPDAATRVLHVAVAPRNNVNVGVRHCLPGVNTIIEPDIETVRLLLGEQSLADHTDEFPHCPLLMCL